MVFIRKNLTGLDRNTNRLICPSNILYIRGYFANGGKFINVKTLRK